MSIKMITDVLTKLLHLCRVILLYQKHHELCDAIQQAFKICNSKMISSAAKKTMLIQLYVYHKIRICIFIPLQIVLLLLFIV